MAPRDEAMKQRSKLERSRLARRPAGAAALFVLLLLPLSPPARATSSNVLPNGSFHAALTIARDGGVADYAIYREGGASVMGTVSGSTTSFADTSFAQSSAVGLWHLDELSGTTAYDSSGHGHDGAISGPVTLGSRASSTPPTASSPRAPSSSLMLSISNRGRRMSRSPTG
jgi:hypothetical protein